MLAKVELDVATIMVIWKHMRMLFDREISWAIFRCGFTDGVTWWTYCGFTV